MQLDKTPLPEDWITDLFQVFQGKYLNKFTGAIKGIEQTAVTIWSIELAGLTNEQLLDGFNRWNEDWPPDAKEFRDRCLNSDLEKTKKIHKDYVKSECIVKCKSSKCFMKEINEILKG